MSFIIKGIDIPKTCRQCPCCGDNGLVGMQRDYFCAALDCAPSIDELDQKLTDCPFVEIPTPHGRLIDADRFLEWLKEFHPNDVVIMSGVKNARTVIEAEANNEQ